MTTKPSSKPHSISLFSIILGASLMIIRTLSVSIHPSPYDMIHKLDINGIIPPLWLLNLSFSVLFFMLGYSAGAVICKCVSSGKGIYDAVSSYRGGMFFTLTFFLLIVHYPLFFILERLLLSLIVAILSVIASIICAISWSRVSPFSTFIMTACAIFSAYLTLINLLILIIN